MIMHKLSYKRTGFIGGLAAALLFFGVVLAAGEGMPRALVGGGGGAVSGDGLRLRTAIGQPLAGVVENGITLCSGFLCGPGASARRAEQHTLYLPLVLR
jgi:hypothetical protein